MQLINVLTLTAAVAGSVNAINHANPFVKHMPARALGPADSYGMMLKRQDNGCQAGYTACGSGCAAGPCCDMTAGLACRPNESCATVNGQMACCPTGWVCDAVRSCENAVGTGCTPGSTNNGALCCDAAAPMCMTSNNTPYCAGIVSGGTYTVMPTQGSGGQSTATVVTTESSTATETVITSNAGGMPTSTETATNTETMTNTETATEMSTMTSTSTATQTVIVESSDILTSTTGTATETSMTTATVVVPYPTMNGTVTGNATATVALPTQATGAASKHAWNAGVALGAVMGALFFF